MQQCIFKCNGTFSMQQSISYFLRYCTKENCKAVKFFMISLNRIIFYAYTRTFCETYIVSKILSRVFLCISAETPKWKTWLNLIFLRNFKHQALLSKYQSTIFAILHFQFPENNILIVTKLTKFEFWI